MDADRRLHSVRCPYNALRVLLSRCPYNALTMHPAERCQTVLNPHDVTMSTAEWPDLHRTPWLDACRHCAARPNQTVQIKTVSQLRAFLPKNRSCQFIKGNSGE